MTAVETVLPPRYRVIRWIASGGAGEVFEAETPDGSHCAIKIVHIDPVNPLSRREAAGAELLRSIRHSSLIRIFWIDVNESRIAMAMELAQGTLRDEFNSARNENAAGIPRGKLLSWLRQVAEALDYLNFEHLVRHLDVKPDNLCIVGGRLKLADFGLARHASRRRIRLSHHAATPAYAAPECFKRTAAPSTDQYSLAVVYVEMLGGRLPYTGADAREIAHNQLYYEPDLAGVPIEDHCAVRKALAFDPECRFLSCTDFISALQRNKVESTPEVPVEADPVETPTVNLYGSTLDETRERPASNPLKRLRQLFAPGGAPTATRQAFLSSRNSLADTRASFECFATQRHAFVDKPNPHELVVFLHGEGGGNGEERDFFVVSIQLFERRTWADATLATAVFDYYCPSSAPEAAAARVDLLIEEFQQAVGVASVEIKEDRRELRHPMQGRICIHRPRDDGRVDAIPCEAMDVARHGLGVVSPVAVPLGAVEVQTPSGLGRANAVVVRCEHRSYDDRFDVGLRLVDGVEFLSGEVAADGAGTITPPGPIPPK